MTDTYDNFAYNLCDAIQTSGSVGQPLIDSVAAMMRQEFIPRDAGFIADVRILLKCAQEQCTTTQACKARWRVEEFLNRVAANAAGRE